MFMKPEWSVLRSRVNPCVPGGRCQLDMGLSSIHTSEGVLTSSCIYAFIILFSAVSWWMKPSYSIKSSLMLPCIQATTSSCALNAGINWGTILRQRTIINQLQKTSWSMSALRNPDWKNLPRFLHLHCSYVITTIHFNFNLPGYNL